MCYRHDGLPFADGGGFQALSEQREKRRLLFNPAEFAKIAVAADKQGMIVHVHAIGDQAVTEALNGIEAARKANGDSGLPHTITHLQLIRPEDIPRFHQLGVIASFQLY